MQNKMVSLILPQLGPTHPQRDLSDDLPLKKALLKFNQKKMGSSY